MVRLLVYQRSSSHVIQYKTILSLNCQKHVIQPTCFVAGFFSNFLLSFLESQHIMATKENTNVVFTPPLTPEIPDHVRKLCVVLTGVIKSLKENPNLPNVRFSFSFFFKKKNWWLFKNIYISVNSSGKSCTIGASPTHTGFPSRRSSSISPASSSPPTFMTSPGFPVISNESLKRMKSLLSSKHTWRKRLLWISC